MSRRVPEETYPLERYIYFTLYKTSTTQTDYVCPVNRFYGQEFAHVYQLVKVGVKRTREGLAFKGQGVATLFTFGGQSEFSPVSLTTGCPISGLRISFFSTLAFLFGPVGRYVLDLFGTRTTSRTTVCRNTNYTVHRNFFLGVLTTNGGLGGERVGFLYGFPITNIIDEGNRGNTNTMEDRGVVQGGGQSFHIICKVSTRGTIGTGTYFVLVGLYTLGVAFTYNFLLVDSCLVGIVCTTYPFFGGEVFQQGGRVDDTRRDIASYNVGDRCVTRYYFRVGLYTTTFTCPVTLLGLGAVGGIGVIGVLYGSIYVVNSFGRPLTLLFSSCL